MHPLFELDIHQLAQHTVTIINHNLIESKHQQLKGDKQTIIMSKNDQIKKVYFTDFISRWNIQDYINIDTYSKTH